MADDKEASAATPALGIVGAIAAAAFVPLILGFSFLSGYLFKLSYFSQLAIPLEFFNHAYFENVSVGTVFVKEAIFTLFKVIAAYFVTMTVMLVLPWWGARRRWRSVRRPDQVFVCASVLAFGIAVIVFVWVTEAKGTLSVDQFWLWLVCMVMIIVAATVAGAGRPYLRLAAIVSVVLVYFLGYVQYAAQRGTLTACYEHDRMTVQVQSASYAFFGNFGDYLIVAPLQGGVVASNVRLIKYSADQAPIFQKAPRITLRACDAFLRPAAQP